MPAILSHKLPWLRIKRRRLYGVGGSMGGQEVLLLVARCPRLLRGAVAFDAVADLARQYRAFPSLRCDQACRQAVNGPLGLVVPKAFPVEFRRDVVGNRALVDLRWPLGNRDDVAEVSAHPGPAGLAVDASGAQLGS